MKQLLKPKNRLLGGRELRFLSIYAPFLCVMALALGTFFYLLDAPDLQQLLPILGLLAGTMLLSGVMSWNFATTLYTKEKDLRENRMLRESFMEKTQSGLFVKDIEGRFLYANDVWCRMLNSSHQAVEGKTDFDFFPREQAQLLQQQDAACQTAPKTFHPSASKTFQSSDLFQHCFDDQPNGVCEFRQ